MQRLHDQCVVMLAQVRAQACLEHPVECSGRMLFAATTKLIHVCGLCPPSRRCPTAQLRASGWCVLPRPVWGPAMRPSPLAPHHLQDSFYRSLTEEEMKDVKNYNFDHPGVCAAGADADPASQG